MKYFWKKRQIIYFLMALLVIFVHSSAVAQYSFLPKDIWIGTAEFFKNLFAYGIGGVAVPMFFILSGMTFFRNYKPSMYGQKIKSRVRTLIIPYLIWNVLGMLFAILCTYTPIANFITSREAFAPSIQNILEGVFLFKYNYVFWFIFELIIFTLLAPVFDLLTSEKWLGWLSVVASLLLVACDIGIDLGFVVFYVLGCMVGKYYIAPATEKVSKKKSLIGIAGFLIIVALRMLSIYNVVDLSQVAQQITLILLCAMIWMVADLFVSIIKPTQIMNETFLIYAIHPYVIAIITKIIYLAFPQISIMAVVNFLVSYLLTILVVKILILGWKRISPKTYSICSGRLTG